MWRAPLVDASQLFPPNSTNYQYTGFHVMSRRGVYSSIFRPKRWGITFSLWGRIPSLGKKGKKKNNNNNGKKKKKKSKDTKIICREGFVEILHFEGGRILPYGGKG